MWWWWVAPRAAAALCLVVASQLVWFRAVPVHPLQETVAHFPGEVPAKEVSWSALDLVLTQGFRYALINKVDREYMATLEEWVRVVGPRSRKALQQDALTVHRMPLHGSGIAYGSLCFVGGALFVLVRNSGAGGLFMAVGLVSFLVQSVILQTLPQSGWYAGLASYGLLVYIWRKFAAPSKPSTQRAPAVTFTPPSPPESKKEADTDMALDPDESASKAGTTATRGVRQRHNRK